MKEVEGRMNGSEKKWKIEWVKGERDENVWGILCKVGCLCEGVDVGCVDGVLFLRGRRCEVDVVECVGGVMGGGEGKEVGYVIVGVVIGGGEEGENGLKNNEG